MRWARMLFFFLALSGCETSFNLRYENDFDPNQKIAAEISLKRSK